MKSRYNIFISTTIFFLSLSIVCSDFAFKAEASNIEVQPNISPAMLTGTINDNLFNNRFVIATAETDNDFTLFSFPSTVIEQNNITCAEVYTNLTTFDVQWGLSWMVLPKQPETQFVQIIQQPNGHYTLIRLRHACIEKEKK